MHHAHHHHAAGHHRGHKARHHKPHVMRRHVSAGQAARAAGVAGHAVNLASRRQGRNRAGVTVYS